MRTCSECTFMNFCKEENNNGKFWCEKRLEYMYADSAECWRFCKAYSRDESEAKSYYDYSVSKQSSGGCYLTTATCDILGLEDKNLYLQTFRRFRKDYLQKNPKGLPILNEYDTVGPIIAHKLKNDKNRKTVALHMLKDYIHPIATNLITKFDGNYDFAIEQYARMTKELIQRYGLETVALTIPGEEKFDFGKDYSEYGHGRKIKR